MDNTRRDLPGAAAMLTDMSGPDQPSFLYEGKSPAEGKHPWDHYKLLATTPADQAFRPLADGKCSIVT